MTQFVTKPFYKCFTQLLFLTILLPLGKTWHHTEKPANSTSQIVFIEGSWDEALKRGAAQNKYIFVDAYASWCGPCKMLKATTFRNSKAAAFFNDNFINVALDMEKGQGPSLAAQWRLQAYPTLIIFNPQGKPVLGVVGFINAEELIRFGKQALSK